MKINDIFESTTSGSVATVATPLGSTQKRQGSLFKGKKTNKKFYESEVSEAEVNEADLILVPGQGKKLKPGFIPKDKDRTDHEVEMARSDLYQAAKNAQKVYALIQHLSEEEGLEGWVQEKIIKANDYLNTIREYLEHKTHMQETTGGVLAGGMSNFEEGVRDLGYDAQSLIMKLRRDIEEKRLQPTPQAVLAAARELAGDMDFAPQLLVKQVLGQGVAEGYDNTTFGIARRKLNVPALIKAGALFVTYPHGEQGWETDNQENWAYSLISLYNVMQGGWPGEAKKYIKPASYKKAEQQINSSAPNLGSDKLVYDGKYNQILWSIKKLGIPDNVAFLDDGQEGVAEGKCVECGGPSYSEESIAEAKDACYNKVKSRYKVWPSAYASGALVKCRKVGASNWGNKSKK
jgi:hypothetical protein